MKKTIFKSFGFFVVVGLLLTAWCSLSHAAEMKLVGDWKVEVQNGSDKAVFEIDPPDYQNIRDEKHSSLPIFNPKGSAWRKGTPLLGVKAYECCAFNALVADTLQLRAAAGDGPCFEQGKDYILDLPSGNIGRVDGGAIGPQAPVFATYRSVQQRIDSIATDSKGKMTLVRGIPHQATPAVPVLKEGLTRLGNIYISGQLKALTDDLLFPIAPEWSNLSFVKKTPVGEQPAAKRMVPQTWKKLKNGETVRILAWGDSVTDAGYLPENERWQFQFVSRLRKTFPKANIILLTQAWGGRNSDTYRNEPAGSPKNYREQVLAVKPDLIISEFVNDSGMNEKRVALRYGEMLNDFRSINTEWIILTPHYVRPDWMGFKGQKNIDNDPRPYVKGLRLFAKENNVGLADASIFYGQLWRKGIPYLTLMTNNINHPNEYGMSLFADALMNMFE